MHHLAEVLLRRWHGLLGLARQSPAAWHEERLREERVELENAASAVERLSETSDVFFSISRARYDGYPVEELPHLASRRHVLVYGYMLAKFTLRWAFYRTAAFLCGVPPVREVINPAKDHKIDGVAARHHIDPVPFKRVCRRLRRVWPLLP